MFIWTLCYMKIMLQSSTLNYYIYSALQKVWTITIAIWTLYCKEIVLQEIFDFELLF